MTLTVERCERLPLAQLGPTWQAVLDETPRYSYFQTPQWSALLDASLPASTACPVLITFSDGGEVVLPLFSTPKRFGFRKVESLPWGAYGGLISAKPITPDHYDAALKAVLSFRSPIVECRINPLDIDTGGLRTHSTQGCSFQKTHMLPLPSSIDDLWSNFQSRNRTAIRRARDEGVTTTSGNDEERIQTLQRLYQRAQEQYWRGVETVPQSFFEALVALDDRNLQIWTAEQEGRIIAADLILYGKNEAQYFIGASNREMSTLNAPRALLAAVLEDGCEQGIQYFNFGGSAGQVGVEQFKTLFGAKERDYVYYRKMWLVG